MRWLKLILLVAMLSVALAVAEEEEVGSLRGVLAQRSVNCNNYPKICHAKGSHGHDCCKNRCVNVSKDSVNCGKCGHRCKFLEICCKGKCVNPFTHTKHCGGCDNKCDQGTKCTYGLCSYAN